MNYAPPQHVASAGTTPAGLRELHRVLKPGGRLVVLEFTVPPGKILRAAYLLYFNRILPLLGRFVSGHPWAYSYLPRSVRGFPGPDALAELLRSSGFRAVEWRLLSGGIAAVHVGSKAGWPRRTAPPGAR